MTERLPSGCPPRTCRESQSLKVATLALLLFAHEIGAGEIRVRPETVLLDRPEACQQLLITETLPDGRKQDVTRTAVIAITPAGVVVADSQGLLRPVADGRAEAVVRLGASEVRVPVDVRGFQSPRPVSFSCEIIPILTKARCNSGGCHGKAEGQNGFKLSVFGFDPESDRLALTAEGRGRRVNLAVPAQSLLLRKATAEVPHGGGLKIERDSDRYRLLCRWVAEGARMTAEGESPTVQIEIEPRERVLLANDTQQLQITAVQADGSRRCVTLETEFESNSANIAAVDERGLIQAAETPGEAVILARYLGHIAVCRVTLPRPSHPFQRPAETQLHRSVRAGQARTARDSTQRLVRRCHVSAPSVSRCDWHAADSRRGAAISQGNRRGQTPDSSSTSCCSVPSMSITGRCVGPICCEWTRLLSRRKEPWR